MTPDERVAPGRVQPAARRIRGVGRALDSLTGNPRFRLLWLSNLFFFGGVWSQTLILGWLVYETTRSEFLVAVFTAVRLAPLLLGPAAGSFADRHDRVRLLVAAGSWAFAAMTVVAVLVSAGSVPYGVLLAGGLAIGVAHSPSQPARAALAAELVGRGSLSNANALNSMALSMTQVIGPGLGGVLISAVGAPASLWVTTAWYVVSLVLLWPLRGHRGATAPTPPPSPRASGGFRRVVGNRLALAVLLVTLAANTLLWPVYQAFMPVFAESLGLGAAGLGWLLACCGAGGVLGALLIAALGDFRFKGGLFVLGTAGWAALWAIFALVQEAALSFVVMGAIGLLSASFGVLQTTLLLLTTERAVHGRALGLQELAIGVMPFSALALGAVAELVGVATTTFASALLLVAFQLVLALRVPELLRYSGHLP